MQSGVRSPEAVPEKVLHLPSQVWGTQWPSPSSAQNAWGVVSGGMGGSRPGHLLPHLPLPRRDQSELEGGRPPGLPEGSLDSPGEVLCLGLVSTAEAWGLGPGLEQATAARGGGGQPPPRPRGGSLPLPDVLIWATGSALSEEPRGRAPARLSGRSSKSKSLRRRRQAPVREP